MSDKGKPEAKEGAATPDANAPKSPILLFLLVLIGVPLMCYAVVDFVLVPKLTAAMGVKEKGGAEGGGHGAAAGGHGAEEPAAKGPKEYTVDMDKAMISLAGSGGSRYLRVSMVLGSKDEKLKAVVDKNRIQMKDAVITVLSALTLGDVEKSDGRDVVKRALISRFNSILGAEVIGQIYFTEFVIQ